MYNFQTTTAQKKTPQSGFTLVETLVAISILLLVIIGPMTIAAKGLQEAYYANEQITAVFLAQEAIESIRNLRDDNALDILDKINKSQSTTGLTTWDWYSNLANFCKSGNGCDIDLVAGPTSYKSCSTLTDCKLKTGTVASNNVVYGYKAGWTDTIFTRTILIGTTVGGGVSVTVTVSWPSRLFTGGPRTVVLQSWIYDQYTQP